MLKIKVKVSKDELGSVKIQTSHRLSGEELEILRPEFDEINRQCLDLKNGEVKFYSLSIDKKEKV